MVRAVFLAMTGEDPPLENFIPPDFLPDEFKPYKPTPEEQQKIDEWKDKKAKLDLRIMADLAKQGKLKRNATRK